MIKTELEQVENQRIIDRCIWNTELILCAKEQGYSFWDIDFDIVSDIIDEEIL